MVVDDDVLSSGSAEFYKGVVHLCAFGLCAACFAYNLGTLATASEDRRRHALNVIIYGAALLFEGRNVRGHWS